MSSRYFCHHCQQSVGLRDTDMICGLCGSDFIEQLPIGGHSFRPALRPGAGDQSGSVPRAQVIRAAINNMGLNSGIPPALRRRATPPPPGPTSRAPRIESLAEGPQQGGGFLERIQALRARAIGIVLNRNQPNDNNTQQGASGTNQGSQEQGDQPNQQRDQNNQGAQDAEQHIHFEDILRLMNNMVNGAGGGGVHIQFHIGDGSGERLHGNLGDYAMGASMDRIISDLMSQFDQTHNNQQLTSEEVSRIPITRVNQKHVDNQTQCSTCFETFVLDEPVAQLNCEHIFHRDCVEPWLRQHATCPMCRTNVDASEWPARRRSTGGIRRNTPDSNAPPGAPAGMVDPDELD